MPDANILPDYSEAWYEEEELADQDNGFVEEYDITAVVLRREEKKQGQVGLVIGMLGIEGLHALDGKLENIVTNPHPHHPSQTTTLNNHSECP